MKKLLICLISISLFFSKGKAFSDEPAKNQPVGKAATSSQMTAATIAWASFGISLLVVVGIIVAIAINKDHHH